MDKQYLCAVPTKTVCEVSCGGALLIRKQQTSKQSLQLQWDHPDLEKGRKSFWHPTKTDAACHAANLILYLLWPLACLYLPSVLIVLAPNWTAPLRRDKHMITLKKTELTHRCRWVKCCSGCSPTLILTSELWGEQQSLEQRVEVAGASLVFDAAQIASPTRRRWLVSPLCTSAAGGRRGEALVFVLLEKIPEHAEWDTYSVT